MLVADDRAHGTALVTGGVLAAIGAAILRNIDAINGILHGLLLAIALVPALLGLKKLIMVEIKKAVTLKLEPFQLNVVLRALEEMPYKLARPIMDEIHNQIHSQVIQVQDVKSEPRAGSDDNAGSDSSVD